MGTARRIFLSYAAVAAIYGAGIPLLLSAAGPAIDRALRLPGLVPPPWGLLAGLALCAWAWFWIAWSFAFLVKRGGGHPNEILGRELAPTTRRLVTEGPYRYTRNPMAYGLILFYFAALAFLRNSISILAMLPVACAFEVWYHRSYEEPGLMRRFGDDYARYRAEVPLLLPAAGRRRAGPPPGRQGAGG